MIIYLEGKPQIDYLRNQLQVQMSLPYLLDRQIQQYRKASISIWR